MHYPYLLPREGNSMPVASLRHHRHAPPLKMDDPAARAMIDFQCVPPLTVTEDVVLEQALDEMFRLGVRAFLVVRERGVIGLVTVEHARGERRLEPLQDMRDEAHQGLRVADVMTLSAEVPAVDWQMIVGAQIRDLIEIFDGSGAQHMVVLENEVPNLSSVRGLIHRGRLERQLGAHWPSTFGFKGETASA
jgi:hypothetical protein